MDRRYHRMTLPEQLALRRQAVDDVLAHPDWTLREAIRHLKRTMRLTSAEFAALSGVACRTVQDIEQGRSEGSVQTMNKLLGVLGLKLAVARAYPPAAAQRRAPIAADSAASPSIAASSSQSRR